MIYDDTIPLVFNHPKLDQLEVTARDVPIATWRRFCELNDSSLSFADPAQADALAEVLEIVAASLVSWNLDDPATGERLPLTVEALTTRPHILLKAIIEAWSAGQVEIPDPFASPSTGGAPPVAIPATPLAS